MHTKKVCWYAQQVHASNETAETTACLLLTSTPSPHVFIPSRAPSFGASSADSSPGVLTTAPGSGAPAVAADASHAGAAVAAPGAGPLQEAPTSEACLLRTRTPGPATAVQDNVHAVGERCIIQDSSTRRVCCQHPVLTAWAQGSRRGVLAAAVVLQRAIMGTSRAEGWQGLACLQPYICAEVRHMLLKVLQACSEGGDLHTHKRPQPAAGVCVKTAPLMALQRMWPSLPPAATAAQAVPCSRPAPGLQAGPPSLSESGGRHSLLLFSLLLLQPRTGETNFACVSMPYILSGSLM